MANVDWSASAIISSHHLLLDPNVHFADHGLVHALLQHTDATTGERVDNQLTKFRSAQQNQRRLKIRRLMRRLRSLFPTRTRMMKEAVIEEAIRVLKAAV